MKKSDVAYLAGLIDGEGCISVVRYLKRGRTAHVARIQMSLTVKPVLDWVLALTKAGSVQPKTPRQPNRKKAWLWVVETNRAVRLLKCVLPFLKIKRKQAENLLRFQSVVRKHNDGRPLSKSELKRRNVYYRISRKLNGGVSHKT